MADKPQQPLQPASDPFPGSRTPGWNDPPTLQYNPSAAAANSTGRTRLNLNKRVAFPLQGTAGGDSNAAAAAPKPTAIVPPNQTSFGLPPPMMLPPAAATVAGATQPIAVVHPMPNMNVAPPPASRVSAPTAVVLTADAQEYTVSLLREQVASVQESLHVRREEIERRLGLIEQLWQSGNLCAPVQEKLYRLAKAIADRNFNEAMEIYTSLVANHSNECSTWAIALRHVVLTLTSNAEATSTSTTVTTTIAAAVAAAHESSNIAVVPAMFVPAMPRHSSSSNETLTATESNNTAGYASVQHI